MIKAYCVKAPTGELRLTKMFRDPAIAYDQLARDNIGIKVEKKKATVVPVTIIEGHEHPGLAILRELREEVDGIRHGGFSHSAADYNFGVENALDRIDAAISALTAPEEEG